MNSLLIVENYLCYLEKDINNRVDESGIGETVTTNFLISVDSIEPSRKST